MELKDKIVFVTGSSSGIGKITALKFAQEGSHVVVHYRENKAGAEETYEKILSLGQKCLIVQGDIGNSNDIERMFQGALSQLNRLDILINNGAIPNDKVPFLEASFDDVIDLIKVDLVGQMICAQKAALIMQKQGSGKILNTSSIRGAEHGGRSVAYAAAKAGINSFTKTFAKLVAPAIQVNAVAPGFVKTRNYDSMSTEQIQTFIDQTYLKRWVTEEEIAGTFVFLAKNDAITGQVVYVDAGFTLK